MTTATMAPSSHRSEDNGPSSSSQSSRPVHGPRSLSAQSSSARSRQRSHSNRGLSADDEDFDDEEAAYDGDDGDGDEDDEDGDGAAEAGEDLISETTVKSGYLMKRGEKRKNWKKRWFVLRSSKLCYYKNEKEYQLLRFIDMIDVHTIAPIALNKRSDSCFGIVTSKRQYYVRAANTKEMQAWVDALRDVREQVQQRSTLTQDMGNMNMSSSKSMTSPTLQPADRQANQTTPSASTTAPGASPINIVIPGKGVYSSPAQPRTAASPSGNNPIIVSPLTATSDSDAGGPTWRAAGEGSGGGAEQFGLSYASSTGQSMASGSPSRVGGSGLHIHQPLRAGSDAISSGGHSPQSHSGGEWSESAGRRSRNPSKSRPIDNRDPSVGSSGGEGTNTGWTAAAAAVGSPQQGAQYLPSSSEEDDEADDWDEGETADRAMPLPSSTAVHQPQLHHSPPQQQQQQQGSQQQQQSQVQPPQSKPQISAIFLKDPNKVIHQGYLMKQSNRRKHWRKRWFILTGNQLSYTRSHMDGKPHRQIPLSSILDALEYTSSKKQPVGGGAAAGTGSASGATAASSGGAGTGAASTSLSSSASGLQSPPLSSSVSFNFGSPNAEGGQLDLARAGGSGFSTSSANVDPSGSVTPHYESSTPTPHPERRGSFIGNAAGAVASTVAGSAAALAGESSTKDGGTTKHEQQQQQHQGSLAPKRKKENCFKIITPKRTYVVCAPSEEEEIRWLSALQALLSHMRNANAGGAAKSSSVGQTAPSTSSAASAPTASGAAAAASSTAEHPTQHMPTSTGASHSNTVTPSSQNSMSAASAGGMGNTASDSTARSKPQRGLSSSSNSYTTVVTGGGTTTADRQ